MFLFTFTHINQTLFEDFFVFSYILAGVVGLDLIWVNRNSIKEVLGLLDLDPLAEHPKYQTVLTKNTSKLKWEQWKFYILISLSYVLVTLLLVYYGSVIYYIVRSIKFPDDHLDWWHRILRIISIYALYFFVSDAALLVSLIWATKYKIKHLNLFIQDLVNIEEHPQVHDIELIKRRLVVLECCYILQ